MNLITVSAPNTDVHTAKGTNVLFSTQYPFTKLDTTSDISFQTISILFNKEPPQPTALSYTNTLIYSFAHGYTYVPSIWMQWQNPSPSNAVAPSPGHSATTYYAFGDDTASYNLFSDGFTTPQFNGTSLVALTEYNNSGPIVTTTQASLVVKVDTQNVYISLLKESIGTISGSAIPINVQGIFLNLRCYVFVEAASS